MLVIGFQSPSIRVGESEAPKIRQPIPVHTVRVDPLVRGRNAGRTRRSSNLWLDDTYNILLAGYFVNNLFFHTKTCKICDNTEVKDPFNKLARLMRTKPEVLLDLERKMNALTGQEGVFEDIVQENDIIVDQTLAGLGLTRSDSAQTVRDALVERLKQFDLHLYELLGKPDLAVLNHACGALCSTALNVFTPPPGMFIKQEKAMAMLEKYPPHTLLQHFGYTTVRELLDREGFASVMAALRFTQSEQWMHQFFSVAYGALTPDDFETRDVELLVLDPKWLPVAEKFMTKKYHNVSHLKEFGIIFIIPIALNLPGDTLRLFSLLLHYLHEVPFYADLFKQCAGSSDFVHDLQKLLRGDVPSGPLPDSGKISWRIVQRYLAKDNEDDFRLFEPHVSPEADHWWHAEDDLSRVSRIIGRDSGTLDLGWWAGLDFAGEVFTNGREGLVSFGLIDLLMSLAQQGRQKYLYHQQEALWNKIFIEYMGRDRMQELIKEHILEGFIILQ